MLLRSMTYVRPFSIDFSGKIGYIHVPFVFENMTDPLVGDGLADVVSVDEHDL